MKQWLFKRPLNAVNQIFWNVPLYCQYGRWNGWNINRNDLDSLEDSQWRQSRISDLNKKETPPHRTHSITPSSTVTEAPVSHYSCCSHLPWYQGPESAKKNRHNQPCDEVTPYLINTSCGGKQLWQKKNHANKKQKKAIGLEMMLSNDISLIILILCIQSVMVCCGDTPGFSCWVKSTFSFIHWFESLTDPVIGAIITISSC